MRKESFRVGLEEIGTAALSGRERGGFKTAGQAESGFKSAGRVNKGARSADESGNGGRKRGWRARSRLHRCPIPLPISHPFHPTLPPSPPSIYPSGRGRVNKGARSTDQRGDNGGAQIEKEGKPAEEKEQQRGVAFAQGNQNGVSVARARTARASEE